MPAGVLLAQLSTYTIIAWTCFMFGIVLQASFNFFILLGPALKTWWCSGAPANTGRLSPTIFSQSFDYKHKFC